MSNENLIQALRDERDGYLRRGLKDRAAAVSAVLRDLDGVTEEPEAAAVEPAAERAVRKRPAKRAS